MCQGTSQTVDKAPLLRGFAIVVRARPCSPKFRFSLIRKTKLWRTNKPPALRVDLRKGIDGLATII